MRVIAVEDEYLGLHSLTRTIKKMCPPDTEVKGFKSPKEALRYAREHPVDVAFLDMEIQQIHGLIMAKELQDTNPKINLIFMSVSSEYAPDAWNIAASDYMLKPFKPQRVEEALTRLRYAAANTG